mgnify:CR=1 FL=1
MCLKSQHKTAQMALFSSEIVSNLKCLLGSKKSISSLPLGLIQSKQHLELENGISISKKPNQGLSAS